MIFQLHGGVNIMSAIGATHLVSVYGRFIAPEVRTRK